MSRCARAPADVNAPALLALLLDGAGGPALTEALRGRTLPERYTNNSFFALSLGPSFGATCVAHVARCKCCARSCVPQRARVLLQRSMHASSTSPCTSLVPTASV